MEQHKNQLKSYKCNYCTRSFILHFQLVFHMAKHENKNLYSCDTCGDTFFTERQLKAHIRDSHTSMAYGIELI